MDLTKRRNVVLLITLALVLLAVTAVLAVNGLFVTSLETMIAPATLAA